MLVAFWGRFDGYGAYRLTACRLRLLSIIYITWTGVP
jgi:hypothetical protein